MVRLSKPLTSIFVLEGTKRRMHKKGSTTPQRKTNACLTSRHMAGDVITFKYEGNLRAEVSRVTFNGCKAVYHVTVTLTMEVPESLVVAEGGL